MPSAMMMTPARNFGTAVLRGGQRRHNGLGPAAAAAAAMIPPASCPNNDSSARDRSLASLARDDGGGGGSSHRPSSHSLLILGKPGGGKGTISGKILSDFPQFRHVSTGDELRRHVRSGTELGREAKRYMDGTFPFRHSPSFAAVLSTVHSPSHLEVGGRAFSVYSPPRPEKSHHLPVVSRRPAFFVLSPLSLSPPPALRDGDAPKTNEKPTQRDASSPTGS